MGKIKNNAKLQGKHVNSVKKEENELVFVLKNGEKITLFVSDSEKNGRKSNGKMSPVHIAGKAGKTVHDISEVSGIVHGIGTSTLATKGFFSARIGEFTLETAWFGADNDYIFFEFTAE